jgi:hypothetical protein
MSGSLGSKRATPLTAEVWFGHDNGADPAEIQAIGFAHAESSAVASPVERRDATRSPAGAGDARLLV